MVHGLEEICLVPIERHCATRMDVATSVQSETCVTQVRSCTLGFHCHSFLPPFGLPNFHSLHPVFREANHAHANVNPAGNRPRGRRQTEQMFDKKAYITSLV